MGNVGFRSGNVGFGNRKCWFWKLEILVLEIGNFGFKKQKFWDGGRYYIISTKNGSCVKGHAWGIGRDPGKIPVLVPSQLSVFIIKYRIFRYSCELISA